MVNWPTSFHLRIWKHYHPLMSFIHYYFPTQDVQPRSKRWCCLCTHGLPEMLRTWWSPRLTQDDSPDLFYPNSMRDGHLFSPGPGARDGVANNCAPMVGRCPLSLYEMLRTWWSLCPNCRLTSRRWILDADLLLKPSHHHDPWKCD